MSKLDRIKPEGIAGSGISGMPSRSHLVRARELERQGLTMEWYDQKVLEQTLDGEVICAECSKSETKRLGNGKLHPLAIDAPRERLICQRCASKQRSVKARIHAAKLKEMREDESMPKSFQDLWKTNRAQLDPGQLAKFQQRHEEMTFLYDVICDYNNGTDVTTESETFERNYVHLVRVRLPSDVILSVRQRHQREKMAIRDFPRI